MPVARPLSELGGRPQEHGRIRFGVKGNKGQPQALKTWRFTSADKEAITVLAGLYGGVVKPWHDTKANPQDQWEVVTTSASIEVMLPPDALSVHYELWGGKGCLRRCDGQTTQALTSNPNDPMVEVPCICNQNGHMECKPKSRLKVLLPQVRMAGFWRMETNSWNAVEELSAMERALSTMQAYGILYARLTLHPQSTQGGSRKFVVPRLEFNEDTQALIDGASTAVGLPSGSAPPATLGLPAGDAWIDEAVTFTEDDFDHAKEVLGVADSNDDDIIEAEIVEDDPPQHDSAEHHVKLRARFHATIAEVAKAAKVKPDELRHGMVRAITQGATESSNDLTDTDVGRIIDYLDEVKAGKRTVQIHDGEVRLPEVSP